MNGEAAQAESGDRHLSVLRRGVPIIVVTAILVGALATAISLRQGVLYQATADVFVSTRSVDTTISGLASFSLDPERVLETQAEVARVRRVADIAVKEADVPGVTASELLGSSSVSANPTADILTFSATHENADAARTLTDAYARAYISYRERQDLGKLRRARIGVDRQLAALKATANPDPQTLGDLESKAEQLRTAELLQGGNVSLGGSPAGASKVQPRPVRDGLLGFILGIVLGIALVFVRDAQNTRVRSTAEMEDRLGIPLLGRIPPPRKQLANTNRLAVIEEPHSQQSEAYRMLATNIELVNLDRGARSFMIASAGSGEGKSTTAASLAITFARSGRRVVLLEADLRRPSIRKMVHLDEGPGLTDVALGRAGLEEALASTRLSADQALPTNGPGTAPGILEVLDSGPPPPSPPEFLKSPAVTEIVSRLTERSDLLIIDTPPLLDASDAMALMLASEVDCVILTARLGVVRRQALSEAKRLLESAPITKLGFIATGASDGGYGYYYYGHYGSATVAPKPKSRAKS